ncbi:TrgA family protein [Cypionkella sp.]|uniref:TrgA family protein n=1 Tax=Cypionkella sp. TaxID=2811411 RepID=UPI003751C96A
MPTASKLVAAVIFAVLGFAAVDALAAHLPEGTSVGWLREITTIIGALVGWFTLGSRGKLNSYGDALGAGLRTNVYTVFWTLLLVSISLMIKRSMGSRYDGPIEAVLGIFDIMQVQARLLLQVDVMVILVLGGALGGLATEWAGRRWT